MNTLYLSYDGVMEPLGQSQILPYLEGLSRRGIIFTLVTFEKKEFFNLNDRKEIEKKLRQKKIKWIPLVYHKRPAVLSTFFDIIYGLSIGIVTIRNEKIKIVHARSYVAAPIALILKKIFKLKFIFDMRGFWADERIEGRIWKKKGVLYYFVKFLENKFLKNADEIVVLTNPARTVIESWGYKHSKISVIPCCVDTCVFNFDENMRQELRNKYNLSGKFIFIHTGSLEHWYMKEEMLDYFKVAKRNMATAHCLVLTHSDKNIILKLILSKGLNLSDFTILSVTFEDMPKYLSMADACLIFITPVFSKLASSPTKFAEYLSCGLPVVANSRVGDLEAYVEANNIGVVIRDFSNVEYDSSFHNLLGLLADKNIRPRCRKIACDNFALEVGINKYQQIYLRLTK